MTDEKDKQSNHYDMVLADLQAEKANIEAAITALMKLRGRKGAGIIVSKTETQKTESSEIQHDTFFGLSIPEATKKYLRIAGKPARSTSEIVEALGRGGLTTKYATVASVLWRASANGEGLKKVGKAMWGLSEWYGKVD